MTTGVFDSPDLIAGPAIIRFPGDPVVDVITEGDINEKIVRETWAAKTSLAGEYDPRLKSQHMELSFTPAGDAVGFNKCCVPTYGVADIGKSIMQAAALQVQTGAGKNIAYSRWALTKPATIRLGTSVTINGDAMITALQKDNADLDAADAFNAVTDNALSLTYAGTFSAPSRRWKAAFGGIDIHFEGPAEITIEPQVEIKKMDAFGAVDIYLKSLRVKAKLKPGNLTEADIYDLMKLQGATAVLPGQSLAKNNQNLVFTELGVETPKTATIYQAGIDTGSLAYGDVTNRNGELTFVTAHRFTGAAPQVLWLFSLV